MEAKKYDRTAQDIGNIVGIGHVNVCITDQHLATNYYVTGLGYTRDPFLNTGSRNMWINAGMSQFHLPMGHARRAARHDRPGDRRTARPARSAVAGETDARRQQVRVPREQ